MAASSQPYNTPNAPKTEPSKASFAFLVHSAETMNHGLPPDVDNKPLARQKRRRTSPEDQAVLEAEYLKNPKPDKAARMDIVRRVALGEKEVQIWFQNRRQSSRRKSRPLLPHEIEQYQTSRNRLNDFSPSADGPASQESIADSDGKQEEDEDENLERDPSPSEAYAPMSQIVAPARPSIDNSNLDASVIASDALSSHVIPSSQESTTGRMGYLANRRSTAPRPSQEGADFEPIPASQESTLDVQPARRQLRKSSSVVRLSMSSNGVARIITDGDSSPSPPRKRPAEPPSSSAPAVYEGDRSANVQSAGPESTQQAASQGTSSLRRKPSGRSLDSRAWEFWCDRDARSELEEKADQEASGSAADAIGLLRSNSGRNILGSLTGKRDSPFRESTSAKRAKTTRTPLIQRAQSFQNKPMARSSLGGKPATHTPRALKKAISGLGIRISTTDSDKENWSPERVVPASERSIRTVETEGRHFDKRGSTTGVLSSTKLSSTTPRAIEATEDDDEVAEFMARGRQSNSASEEEELDCVQGLLSLSQGNWR